MHEDKSMPTTAQGLGEAIAAALPGAIRGYASSRIGELTLTVEPARLIETVRFLRDDPPACSSASSISPPSIIRRASSASMSSTHLLSPKHNLPHPGQGRDRRG